MRRVVAYVRDVFDDLKRVLVDDGTAWLSVGDVVAGARGGRGSSLEGVPWRVALALQRDGWVLRNAIVWSIADEMSRRTLALSSSYETLLLFAKQRKYSFDLDAVRVASRGGQAQRRNPGDVWFSSAASSPRPELPFDVASRCITAGCPRDGVVVDPFHDAASLCRVFAEVKHVLTPTGTCWVNLGDSYGGSWGNYVASGSSSRTAQDRVRERRHGAHRPPQSRMLRKSLIGLPWRVAFAMRQDGWLLRSAVVWHKPNAAPESVRDRFSTSYETVFLFAASDRHYLSSTGEADLWSVPVRAYRGAHNAVGPVDIAAKAIELGCPRRGVVLDPFSGTATTGVAARALGHRYIGIDLNPAFHDLAIARFVEQEGVTPWQPSR